MASNNRSGGSNRGRRRNNNPEGRNQYSGLAGTVRGNPFKAALAAGGAVAAGVFLWSRRNQLSDQIGDLGERLSDWRGSQSDDLGSEEAGSDDSFMARSESRGSGKRTQAEIAEEALTLKETGQAG